MTELDTFIDFAARYDNAFPRRIVGAAPERIERLQELVGRPLPRLFRDYLERMGVDEGGLLMQLDADCRLDRLIQAYETASRDHYERAAYDGFVPLGYGNYQGDYFVEIGASDDARVFSGERPEPIRLHAESFHKSLYRASFWAFYLLPMPYGSAQGARDLSARLDQVRRFCLDQALKPHWFCEDAYFCGEGDDITVYVQQPQDDSCFLRLGSHRRSAAAEFRERLLREFGFLEVECRL